MQDNTIDKSLDFEAIPVETQVAPTSGKRGSSRKSTVVTSNNVEPTVIPKRARSVVKSRPESTVTNASDHVESAAIPKRSHSALKSRPESTVTIASEHVEPAAIPKRSHSVLKSHPESTVVETTEVVVKTPRVHKQEPLLTPNPHRYVLFPIEHPDIFAMYKKHQASEWKAEEVKLDMDLKDWEKLTENERHFIKHVLAFFAASDGIVMENLALRFSNEVQWAEARQYYAVQMKMEAIHCVAPETPILTDAGYFPIVELEGKHVNVWNGEEFSGVDVVQTSSSAKLLRVRLSNGMELQCTEKHKWFIREGPKEHPERCRINEIFTCDLKPGYIICKYELPVLLHNDTDEFKNPYTHGIFCGDGTYANSYPFICLYGDKRKLLPYMNVSTCVDRDNKYHCYLTNCINKLKYFVPINYSIETKLRWLEGYVDADGCINSSKKKFTSIQITSIESQFLKNIQLMLTTLGVHTNIRLQSGERKTLLPDGKGGKKMYNCKAIEVMYIRSPEVHKLQKLGFAPKRLILNTDKKTITNPQLITVVDVVDEGRISPTYCFTESKRHAGTFAGIVTGQSETYSLLIDTYIKDIHEKSRMFNAIDTIPCIGKKAKWAMQWIIDKDSDFATRLLAFAIVEGIFFSGAFCAIYWLKERGLMPGLTSSNEWIARDEALHTEFACLLYSHLRKHLSKSMVYKIMRQAIKIEKEFICDALPCSLIGMKSESMCQYLEYVADRLLVQLGYPKLYEATNPFDFMDRIGMEGKTNFFEKTVTSYANAGIDPTVSGSTSTKMIITSTEDF